MGNFQELFQELENSSKSIGIEYVSISMTTLEEVFLRLGESDSHEKSQNLAEDSIENFNAEFDKNQNMINNSRVKIN